MKRLLFLLIAIIAIGRWGYGQINGTFTIGVAPFTSVAFTIDSLNAQPGGVGTTSGVTFLVPAGYVESFTDPTDGTLTATGSAGALILFVKSGTGANPILKAATGVNTTTDGIVKIAGGDYITFDGIDLQENAANTDATTQMEWGYALVKKSSTAPFNGCQYVTIKNCVITLNKANVNSVGIYTNNHIATATTPLTITATTDAMNFCKFYGNTISNVYTGIFVRGYNASTPFTLYDHNNEIGRDTANIISNYGGGSTTAYGIYAIYQDNLKIVNNTISGGTATTTTLYGIFTSTGTSSNVDIYDNRVTITGGGTTSTIYGISNAMGSTALSNTVNINDNLIFDCTYPTATSGAFTGIVNTGSAAQVNVFDNIVRNNTLVGTGTFTGIDAGTGTNQNFQDNRVYSNSKTSSGTMYCLRASTSQIILLNNEVYDNFIDIVGGSSSGTLYGYYNLGSPTLETYTGNKFYNLTVSGTTSGTSNTVRALYTNTTALDVKNWSLNQIYNLTVSATGGGNIYGIYTALGATVNIFRNKMYGFSCSGTNPSVYGIYIISGTTVNIYNNLIGNLETPAASAAIPLAGIYISGGTNVNLYYNTVYLNASSTGTLFGSAAVYASTTPTVLFKNNLFVNTSTANGTGRTAVHRRSGTTLTTYASGSDYNYYYAGTPDSNNVIFFDGTTTYPTMANYQTLVAPRDAASATNAIGPSWLSTVGSNANFLHIDPTVPSPLESGGIIIAGYDNDFDNQVRFGSPGYVGTGTAPDIGADEYSGLPNYTCTSPTPGATVASSNPVCFGQSVTLSLQNAVPGTGILYQWMFSSDGGAYSNISGAVASTYTFAATSTGYYQCLVTCQNGPSFAISTPVQITFSSSVTSTTPGSRCGVGTVNLAASGSAGTTLGWYAAATGGTPLGSGSPFTTPVIDTTTTFYVGAEVTTPATITVGAGASTSTGYQSPFYHLYGGLKSQYLIRASELSAAGLASGNISSLSFDVVTAGIGYRSFNLSIGSTALNALTTTLQSGLTTVFTDDTLYLTTGIFTINFTTPFAWDGSSNIIIQTCWSNNNTGGTTATVKYDATSFVALSYYRADNQPATTICAATTATSTLSARPKMVFGGLSVCSSQRVGVVATVTAAPDLTVSPGKTICNGEVYAISVTSAPGNFDTYTWSPIDSLFTDLSCTIPYVALSSATTLYVKSTTPLSRTYTCTATKVSTNCVNTADVPVVVLPVPTINATPEAICISGSSVLTISPATGYGAATFQWQESTDNITFTDISGATGLSYTTPTLTSSMYYKFILKNSAGLTCSETIYAMQVNDPQITSTTPGSRCGVGTVALGATGTGGTINWYDVPLGGAPLGTGTSFITPVIDTTTSYWVGSVAGGTGGAGSVGPVDFSIGTGGNVALTYHLFFDVLATTMTLNGVYVYPGAVGNVRLHISNSAGTVLKDITYPVTATGVKTYIPINFDIPNGTAYRIGYNSASGGVSMYRNTSGASYPYTLPGIVSITGNSFSGYPQYYYYCYDWQVSTGCSSPRTEVVATVTPGPPFSVNADQTVCNNGVATLQVTSILADYDTYVWSPATNLFTDVACTLPYNGTSSYNILYAKTASAGVYTYTCTATKNATQCVSVDEIQVTVMPDNPVITAIPENICISGSATLSVTPSSGWGAASFQWQESTDNVNFTNITGANGLSYTTPTITATTYYRLEIRNSIGILCTSPAYTLAVNNPQVTGTTPGSRCGTGTVSLGATGTPGSTLNWYASASGGSSLGTGNTFVTPVIDDTTTYYVSASAGVALGGSVGAPNTSISTSLASQTTTTAGINFDVLAGSVTILSMDIYPTASIGSAFTITVKQGTNVIASYSGVTTVQGTISVPVVQTVPVNFVIPNGTAYQVTLPVNPGVIRNSGGDAFPYTIAGLISLTSSTLSTYYYYLYNWQVLTGCQSPLVPVVATVTPAPAITASATPPSICVGSSSQLNVTSGNPGYTYVWNPGNLSGAAQTVSPSSTTTYTVAATDAGTGCAAFANVNVTVNPLPTPVIVTPPTAIVGTITQLVASGGTLGGDYIFGTSTTTNTTTGYPAPYTNYYGGTKHQMLIRATEMLAAGMSAGPINSVTFSVVAVGTTFSGSLQSFQISMKNTATTAMTTTFESGFTLVYGPQTVPIPTTGLPTTLTHTLSAPFIWDGTSNLLIETSYSNNNAGTATDFVQMYNNDPGFVSTAYYRVDSQTAAYVLAATTATGTSNARPNLSLNGLTPAPITWSPLSGLYTDAGATIAYTGDARNSVYANPAAPVTYTATATSPVNCTSSGTCVFSAPPQNKPLSIRLFLEGLYDGAGGMNQAFNEIGPQWPEGVADKVTLELRDGTTGALVHTISNVDLSTSGYLNVNVPSSFNGSYYIYVYHRNSIITSTANPVSFSGSSITFDFSTGIGQAFGSNMKDISGTAVIFGGDENQDGLVDSTDMIDADNDAANFAVGYLATDVNGDGLVDSSDMILIDNNSSAFIATVLPF